MRNVIKDVISTCTASVVSHMLQLYLVYLLCLYDDSTLPFDNKSDRYFILLRLCQHVAAVRYRVKVWLR